MINREALKRLLFVVLECRGSSMHYPSVRSNKLVVESSIQIPFGIPRTLVVKIYLEKDNYTCVREAGILCIFVLHAIY